MKLTLQWFEYAAQVRKQECMQNVGGEIFWGIATWETEKDRITLEHNGS
jgi:hypothetical protein